MSRKKIRVHPCKSVAKFGRPLTARMNHAFRLPNPGEISQLLREKRAPACALVVARPGERSHAAVYQRGHEPVQRRLPGPGEARLQPPDDVAEVGPRGGEA